MKKLIVSIVAALALVCSFAVAAPTVESYAAPKLVSEINTALATLYSYVYTNTASGITAGNLPVAQITNALAISTALTVGGTLDITGAATITGGLVSRKITTVTESTTTRVCTSADYGKLILIVTNAAVAITLPANGAAAGSTIEFMIAARSATLPATDDCAPTISAATADTLYGPNTIGLDSVTWATSHRIGARAKFESDGFFWHVQNLGGTTMTYTE